MLLDTELEEIAKSSTSELINMILGMASRIILCYYSRIPGWVFVHRFDETRGVFNKSEEIYGRYIAEKP